MNVNDGYLDNDVLSHIWVPDVYVDYGREIKTITLERKSMLARLFPDGSVFYSIQ